MVDAIIYEGNIIDKRRIVELVNYLKKSSINTVLITNDSSEYDIDCYINSKGNPYEAFLKAIYELNADNKSCIVYDFSENLQTRADGLGFFTCGINNKCNRILSKFSIEECVRGLFLNIPSKIDNIDLFILDAGNVLIFDIDCMPSIVEEYCVDDEYKSEIIKDYFDYQAPLDSGNMSTESYWKHIEKDFNIKVVDNPFEKHFCPRINNTMQDVVSKIINRNKRVVLGSNTFAPHMIKITATGALDKLSKIYTSYELGYYKPQKSFFEAIMKKEGVAPNRVYFIDDNFDNIVAASSIGINTFHYYGENKDEVLLSLFKDL
ncbi:MAG: HAD family hydrolase [Pleomorphochaeta sp.]